MNTLSYPSERMLSKVHRRELASNIRLFYYMIALYSGLLPNKIADCLLEDKKEPFYMRNVVTTLEREVFTTLTEAKVLIEQ
jgi:hypothetical protein